MSLNTQQQLNPHEKVPVTGVILAGGKSRRMGQNKALIQLGSDTLIGHVIDRMRLVTDELLLITNTPAEYVHLGVSMYDDIIPDTGTLGGIYTGLTYASYDAVLCVGCDSPFLVPNLLTYLVSVLGEHDAVMPYTYKEIPADSTDTQIILQTLCAAYAKRCLPIIELMLHKSELRVHALAEHAHVQRVPPEVWQVFDAEGVSFFNINTPEDFERANSYMEM